MRLFLIRPDELIECDVARAGVAHVGRDGRRAVRGAERAGNPTSTGWVARFGGVGGFARETSAGAIELTRDLSQPIVLERNSVGVERIGLDQVRARLQVFGVDIADQGGLREAQDVIGSEKIGVGVGEALTPEVLFTELVALNHRAHRAV